MSKIKWLGVALLLLTTTGITMASAALTSQEQLGKDLFFDENLSEPKGEECAVCHGPSIGYTGPSADINKHGSVYEGAVSGRFGNRKPPSAAYAGGSPVLSLIHSTWSGGMFWDGRATGSILGDPLAEQAQGPFLNPLEQNLPNAAEVISRVEDSNYSELFNSVCSDASTTGEKYDCIGKAIAAYERSTEVSSFSSKFDVGKLTTQEKRGLKLFRGKAKCDKCHISTGKKASFTDYTYDNIGIPRNPENPFYNESAFNPLGSAYIDQGLGGFLASNPEFYKVARTEIGKFKVPTLRNVAKGSCEVGDENGSCITKAYGHNGYFKSLKEIVHFYNTRDVMPVCGGVKGNAAVDCWPIPEEGLNINKDIGNLGLSQTEESDIVAFLGTLSDQGND